MDLCGWRRSGTLALTRRSRGYATCGARRMWTAHDYAVPLGDADLEECLLRNADTGHFRSVSKSVLEGLATKTLNFEMLIERPTCAQGRRLVPEAIVRFLQEAAPYGPTALKPIPSFRDTKARVRLSWREFTKNGSLRPLRRCNVTADAGTGGLSGVPKVRPWRGKRWLIKRSLTRLFGA
jgi:hypothetical protein